MPSPPHSVMYAEAFCELIPMILHVILGRPVTSRSPASQQNRNQGFSKPGFSQEPELWLWVHQTQKLFRRITFIRISKI